MFTHIHTREKQTHMKSLLNVFFKDIGKQNHLPRQVKLKFFGFCVCFFSISHSQQVAGRIQRMRWKYETFFLRGLNVFSLKFFFWNYLKMLLVKVFGFNKEIGEGIGKRSPKQFCESFECQHQRKHWPQKLSPWVFLVKIFI